MEQRCRTGFQHLDAQRVSAAELDVQWDGHAGQQVVASAVQLVQLGLRVLRQKPLLQGEEGTELNLR